MAHFCRAAFSGPVARSDDSRNTLADVSERSDSQADDEVLSESHLDDDEYFDELKLCLRSSMPAPLRYYRTLKSPNVIRATRQLPMLEFYRNTTRSGEIEGGEGVTVRGTPKQRQVDRRTGLFLSVFGRLRCDSCA